MQSPAHSLERVLRIVTETEEEAGRRVLLAGTGSLLADTRVTTPGRPTTMTRVSELNREPVLAALRADRSLQVFLRNDRIAQLPAKMSRRRLLLGEIVHAFEPGIRYPERAVDDFLRSLHDDHAALRRYLVDEGFLERAQGVYWRIASRS